MKVRILAALVFVSLAVMSCKNSTAHTHEGESEEIELNSGEKWQVNTEMTPFILEGEQILGGHADGDYKVLAAQLKDKNSGLIKSCTMDGKSHDELHKWLHPHLELVEALNEAQTPEAADLIIANLKKSFETYHTYFQ